MNLKCLICSDLLLPSAEIYATTCGHLFHYNCLLQWIERSRTCPQCRSKSTESSIHRVYLSVDENAEPSDSTEVLQHKLDNLQFQIKLKDMDIKNYTEKYKTSKAQNTGLREEIKDLENRLRVLESAMHALKEQVSFFKGKAKVNDKLEDELMKLRAKLNEMTHVQLVITGSREQVNDMLRQNRDPESLSVLVSTLKQELLDSDRRRKKIQSMLRDAQNESQIHKRDVVSLTKEKIELQQEVEVHKNCETERHYLKRKIGELQEKCSKMRRDSLSVVDTSVRRIMAESPAPLSKQINQLKDEACKSSSPTMSDAVQSIKDSNSPRLRVQSSTVGLSGLMNYNSSKCMSQPSSTVTKPTKFQYSIFKQQPINVVEITKKPPSQSSYNGLGGHSKDEAYHTTWQPPAKRPKSSATVISAKFKKLAPTGPQKKLNDFFTDSTCN